MAEKSGPDLHREIESLRTRLHRAKAALAKHRQLEEDLQLANARLEAEIQQLRVDLQKQARISNIQQPVNAAHVARLVTLGEQAASFAHELAQPLAAIATYAQAGLQMLTSSQLAEKEVGELLQRIAGQAERSGELMRRLRRFAARGEAELQPVHINDVVRDALTLSEIELRTHGVHTCLQLAKNIPTILADAIQLGQVLVNLIGNAIEAMHTSPVSQRLLTITTRIIDSELEVSVSDSGSGISPETVRNLFEAFNTTKPDGLGLGLSICRTIVQAHNGRLWVKPNPRRGTIFFIALPLSKP